MSDKALKIALELIKQWNHWYLSLYNEMSSLYFRYNSLEITEHMDRMFKEHGGEKICKLTGRLARLVPPNQFLHDGWIGAKQIQTWLDSQT